MIDFSKKRVLIVDDSQAMCSSLRITLSNFGITRSEASYTAGEALYRIRSRSFDMIVCDYNLGEGTDGQQLLEYVRREGLISPAVVFLMVTAERAYEKVVLCAEMAPDDYLLKPFTAETMRVRLERVFDKKAAFAEVYAQMSAHQLGNAIDECDRLLTQKTRYVIDVLRLKGELLLEMGREAEARVLYEQVLSMRAIPWARLGLARAMRNAGQLDNAMVALKEAIQEQPEFLTAYDELAQTQTDAGMDEDAQQTLQAAVRHSPGNLIRQTALGEVAYRNQDLEAAGKAFEKVVGDGKYSLMRNHKDFVNLSRVQMEQKHFDKAVKTIGAVRDAFGSSPEIELAASTMEALIHQSAANHEAAQQALARALKARQEAGLMLSDPLAIDLAKAAFLNGQDDVARGLVRDMVSNFYDDQQVQQSVRQMLEAVGRGHESKALIDDSVLSVVKLNNEGVIKARQGDLAGAIDLLLEATRRMPQNIQLALNAAQAMIVESERNGWHDEHMHEAKRLIDTHQAAHGHLAKFKKIKDLLKETGLKYGVHL